MHHRRLNKPRSVMFSGTGSKILDIIGNNEALNLITQTIFEMTYNENMTVTASPSSLRKMSLNR